MPGPNNWTRIRTLLEAAAAQPDFPPGLYRRAAMIPATERELIVPQPEFFAAFGIQAGDPMRRASELRAKSW